MIQEKLKDDVSMQVLVKLVLLFVVVLLIQSTAVFWKTLFGVIWRIIKPFFIGFVIAFVLKAPVKFAETRGIPRRVTVPVIYICILLFLFWIVVTLVPMITARSSDLINSLIGGINWIYETLNNMSGYGMPPWITGSITEAVNALSGFQSFLPNLSASVPHMVTSAISTLTTSVFAVIISIFMCFEWEKIRFTVLRLCHRVSRKMYDSAIMINEELSDYVRSLLTLMLIRFFEYILVYVIVGHPDWLILALLTSISLIVPYIGPTIINTIGIITALTLEPGKIILLISLILVLSNVDEYVISPLVHARNTNVTPLWALFSIFAGNAIAGVGGIIAAIPVFLIIRILLLSDDEADGQKQKTGKVIL